MIKYCLTITNDLLIWCWLYFHHEYDIFKLNKSNKFSYYHIIMEDKEYHIIRVSCIIHKLILHVKFPCTITFQLKNCIFLL